MMDKIVSDLCHGEQMQLCDSIFQFYQPKKLAQLEVVFVHGSEHHNCGDAYWKTWLARDGTTNNVWPMTWLPDEFPSTKVFALKYDANIKQTAIEGRMDLFLVGETLVQEMVMFGHIGQSGVPVVFVCHGFGGLVAKQIVISAKHRFSQDPKAQKLLKNIGAILFYSTPHHGSHLVKSSSYFSSIWGDVKGPLQENLKVLNPDTSRLNQEFVQVAKEHSWYLLSAAGTHATKRFGGMVVEEASSRFEGSEFLALSDDHFDVVRPKTQKDSSYLWLTKCLDEVLKKHVVKPVTEVKSLVLDSFVRLEAQEKAIKTKLQEVSIVGLVGMGGIGKTTLARVVYQSIHKDFENSCYLDDVKSKASLDEVLITLLQNFGIKDRKTGCIVERSGLQDCKNGLLEELKMYVRDHKVLVVMDDVGTKENFECLLEYMNFLSGNKESKVIVTCRNWQVLKDYVQGSGRYEVEPISCGQDTELLIYHAFEGARTVEQRREKLLHFLSKDSSKGLISKFESKCDDVVKACGGLPLSLEVMGCCLGGYLKDSDLSSMECLDCWRGALEKLERAEPLEGGVDNDRLWKVLQISYDCLHENEQNMFLDIACFFCDSMQYGKQTLLWVWGGNCPKTIEFKNLKERCLVKINEEDGSVTMHDQLRDMGRNVVRRQCNGVLSEMTRLWNFEDVSKLLQSNEIIAPRLQGVSLDAWRISSTANMEGKSIWTSKRLQIFKQKGFRLDCPTMRLLDLHKVQETTIEAMSIKSSSCIQWLCLKGINMSKLPKFVQVCSALCVLDMRDCRYLKNLDKSIANLVNLLELNLSGCTNLVRLPNSLGDMVNLTRLDLSSCKRLRSLPNSIGKLVKLSTLDISGCERLRILPDSIGKLVNLSLLCIHGCEELTSLPNSIGNMVHLTTLDASWCKGLRSLPDSIGKLVNLSTLCIHGCKGLTSLPDSIGDMDHLTTLDATDCVGLRSLPDSIGKLVNLSTLFIFGCEGLTSLPDSIGDMVNLTTLYATGCQGLKSLPNSIGKLVNLSTLWIYSCEGFTSLSDSVGDMIHLTTLYASDFQGLRSLPDSIGKLVNLSTLSIYGCKGLTSLPDSIGDMVHLTKLVVRWCKGLRSLPNSIGKLVNLSTLQISGCEGLTKLPDSIGNMVNLTKLDAERCKRLQSLPDSIGKLVNLSLLHIHGCKGLTSLPDSIGDMVHLTTLDATDCVGLRSLPDSIGKLVNLSTLWISGCKGLISLPDSIGDMVHLTSLYATGCKGLRSLPNSIGKLVNLSTLFISGCKGLTSLPDSIGDMVHLTTLYAIGCKGLRSLPNSIGKLVNLSTLFISSCKGLTSLPNSIGDMVHLTTLDAGWCNGLKSLPNSIGKLVNLSTLDIHSCEGLTSLPDSIGNMVNLTTLDAERCKRLRSLPDSIGKLVNLSLLRIHGCEGLTSLPDSIGNMVHLTTLDATGCKGLTSLPDSIKKSVNLSTLDFQSSSCLIL